MAHSAGFEGPKDLVLRAQNAGFEVSADQIARWNRDGLLPRLRQKGLGQGLGSEIRYPIGTGDQLLVLCEIHAEFRKLEDVGWYLWLNGFEVSKCYWQRRLVSAVDFFVSNRRIFKQKLIDTTGGVISLRRLGERTFDAIGTTRTENRHLRRMRRRVGSGQIGEFGRVMTILGVGAYRDAGDLHEDESETERELLKRGFGLKRAWVDRIPSGETLLTGDIEPDLEQLSGRLAKVSKASLLKIIHSPEIGAARDELRLLFGGLQAAYKHYEAERGKHAFGLGVIADFGTITDIRLQALVILFFAATIRTDPHNRLREILGVIQAKRVGNGRQLDSVQPHGR